MRKLQGLQLTAVVLLAAAAILWAIIIAAIWVYVPDRAEQAVRALAPTLTVTAAIFWVGGHNSRRAATLNQTLVENNRVLIGTMGHVILPSAPAQARRAGTVSQPLRAV